MKNNQLTAMLLGLVFLSTLASAFLIYKYNSHIRTLQQLGPELAGPTAAQNLMQSLFNDTAEYERATKNADMLKILESVPGAKMVKPVGKQ